METVAQPKTRTGGWHFFDAVYCITLTTRPDRHASAAAHFKAVGLQDIVKFVTVEKHPEDNEQGIYESHMRCMAKGLAAGARHILIFEDDIVFRGFSEQKLRQCIGFLDQNDSGRILFLGCLVTKSRRTQHPGIRSVDYRALTHAYVIENSLAAELVAKKWPRKPYDVVLAELPDVKFACCPSFAFQSNSPSDNKRLKRLETIRRLCGGLGFIQKMNERYHRHKAAIITAHLLLAGALLWWCLR